MSHVMGGIQWVLQSNTTLASNSSGLVGNNNSENAPSATGTQPRQTQSLSNPSPVPPQ